MIQAKRLFFFLKKFFYAPANLQKGRNYLLKKMLFFSMPALWSFFKPKLVPDIATKRDYQPEDASFLQKEERGYSV